MTTILVAILAALPPTLAGLGALIVSLRTDQKTKEIHVLVNSQHDAMVKDLAAAQAQIAALNKIVTTLSAFIHPAVEPVPRPPASGD